MHLIILIFSYPFVDHKVINHVSPPYALTKCCLPFPHIRLDQVLKHMIERVYSDATRGKQTPAILALHNSTRETINKYNP